MFSSNGKKYKRKSKRVIKMFFIRVLDEIAGFTHTYPYVQWEIQSYIVIRRKSRIGLCFLMNDLFRSRSNGKTLLVLAIGDLKRLLVFTLKWTKKCSFRKGFRSHGGEKVGLMCWKFFRWKTSIQIWSYAVVLQYSGKEKIYTKSILFLLIYCEKYVVN